MITMLDKIVHEIGATLGLPITIGGPGQELLAYNSQHTKDLDRVRIETIVHRVAPSDARRYVNLIGISSTDKLVKVPPNPDIGMFARLCVPLRNHGHISGYLWISDPLGEFSESIDSILHDYTRRLEEAIEDQRQFSTGLALSPQRVIQLALSEDPSLRADAERISTLAGWPGVNYGPFYIAYVEAGEAADFSADTRFKGVVNVISMSGGFSFGTDDRHRVLIIPSARHQSTIGKLRQTGDTTISSITLGVSDPICSVDEIREAYHQSKLAQKVASLRSDRVGVWSDLGSWVHMAEHEPCLQVRDTIVRPIRRLKSVGHGFSLFQTLESFLRNGGSVQKTAESLHLHRSSLYGRLARIESLINADLRDGETQFELQYAIRMERLWSED